MKKGDRVNLLVEYIGPYLNAKECHIVKSRMTDNNITPGIELIVHESVLTPVGGDNENNT